MLHNGICESIMLILSPFFRLSVFKFPCQFQITLIKRCVQFHPFGIRQKLLLDRRSHIFHSFWNIGINSRCGCRKNRAPQCTSLFRSNHRYRQSEHISAYLHDQRRFLCDSSCSKNLIDPDFLFLKMFNDSSQADYGATFAMSVLSLVPILIIFFFFQKQLVEGISTQGLKG